MLVGIQVATPLVFVAQAVVAQGDVAALRHNEAHSELRHRAGVAARSVKNRDFPLGAGRRIDVHRAAPAQGDDLEFRRVVQHPPRNAAGVGQDDLCVRNQGEKFLVRTGVFGDLFVGFHGDHGPLKLMLCIGKYHAAACKALFQRLLPNLIGNESVA